MLDLTFGEQVKIILSRKGMTIKELAEIIEERTGKKMSRQNLTQRLGRDNFQEQDMRMIADILGCPFQLSILADSEAAERASNIEDVPPTEKELSKLARAKARKARKTKEAKLLADAMDQVPSEIERESSEKEMTIGDYIDIHEELKRQETGKLPNVSRAADAILRENMEKKAKKAEPVIEEEPAENAAVHETAMEESVREESATEEIVSDAEQSAYEEEAPAAEQAGGVPENEALTDVETVLRELEEMEGRASHMTDSSFRTPEEPRREEKKIGGWRAIFQRRPRKERQEELREEEKIEQQILRESVAAEDDYIEQEESAEEEALDMQQEMTEVQEESAAEPAKEEIEEDDDEAEDLSRGEVNPYTGHEYESNSVRMHPKRIGYVQVYDRKDHAWTDMTEWAFLGYQERKKALLGKDYEPPIYLD